MSQGLDNAFSYGKYFGNDYVLSFRHGFDKFSTDQPKTSEGFTYEAEVLGLFLCGFSTTQTCAINRKLFKSTQKISA